MNIPVNADGSADVLGVWYHMLEQGKKGSSFKMVEGIRNVHRFIHDSRFYQTLKRGINIEILLAAGPQDEEETKMIQEIKSASELYQRKLLFESNPPKYMEIEARSAYDAHGLTGLVDHFKERIQLDGKPLDEQQANQIAVAFEKEFYSGTGGKK